jgi:hypothetical protein
MLDLASKKFESFMRLIDIRVLMLHLIFDKLADELLASKCVEDEKSNKRFVQFPHVLICSQMKSGFSGAEEILNGCHSYFATVGILMYFFN